MRGELDATQDAGRASREEVPAATMPSRAVKASLTAALVIAGIVAAVLLLGWTVVRFLVLD